MSPAPFISAADTAVIQSALYSGAQTYALANNDGWEFSMIPSNLWPYLAQCVAAQLNDTHAAPAGNKP